jgi:hypothetical protein
MDAAAVRSVTIVPLVDTGATMLTLPEEVCRALGLAYRGVRRVRYADGRIREVPWVGGILLEILGRQMTCDALVEREGTGPAIGQIERAAGDMRQARSGRRRAGDGEATTTREPVVGWST